jgi:hypothetical protein
MIPRSTKSVSRVKGITIDGFGGVSSRSRAGPLSALGSLDPLILTKRGMVMELSIDLAVDYSGLEAGVSVAKRDRRCHRNRVVLQQSGNSS